jgi:hypothetical protein
MTRFLHFYVFSFINFLRTVLSSDLFEAAAMRAVNKDLMEMKVSELKEELEARGEGRGGFRQQGVADEAAPPCGDSVRSS